MAFDITIENYEQKRKELLEANSNQNALILRESEKALNTVLSRLKAEFREARGGEIAYDIPVLTDPSLRESRLYRFCLALPKGAELHVHDMALLPAKELIDLLVEECPEFCISADPQCAALREIPLNEPIPDGFLRLSEALARGIYSREMLVRSWTLTGDEEENVWERFERLFSCHDVLSDNPPFAEIYYKRAFRYYCAHRVQHIEIHMMMTSEMEENIEYLRSLRRAYYAVKQEYPSFTLRIIGAGVKADNAKKEMSKKCFLNASYAQEILKDESIPGEAPNFIIGYDLVNEEDGSLTLHDFAPMLLRIKRRYPEMKLYLHGGESLDARNENLIDAYLLGVSRVGHGFNLYRYPDLHLKYMESEICLEVCPISNRVLHYSRDLRNHPATEYLRTGVPIALCSDDPAYMENESLTDDFFAGIVAWDLDLADLKQLAINSLVYSGLEQKSKTRALHAFGELWQQFVEESLWEYRDLVNKGEN